MGKRLRIAALIVLTVILIAGLSTALWPVINGYQQDRAMASVAQGFLATAPTGESRPSKPVSGDVPAPTQSTEPTKPDPLREAMEAYNDRLRLDQRREWGRYGYDTPPINLADYGITDGVIAALEIPSLKLELPVYLGANNANLKNGAAVTSFSSMPIGGTGSCCVIAGHRSYRGAAYFKALDKLELGDKVILTNRWERMIYLVQEIRITTPDDTGALEIRPGKDIVILYSCNPMYSTRQRILVICERAEEF